jgi:hypothetical protein
MSRTAITDHPTVMSADFPVDFPVDFPATCEKLPVRIYPADKGAAAKFLLADLSANLCVEKENFNGGCHKIITRLAPRLADAVSITSAEAVLDTAMNLREYCWTRLVTSQKGEKITVSLTRLMEIHSDRNLSTAEYIKLQSTCALLFMLYSAEANNAVDGATPMFHHLVHF